MKRLLISCGIFAAVLYVATVVLGGFLRPGYSHLSEPVSQLVAAGAPSRSLLSSLFLIYNVLLSAFGVGLFLRARDQDQESVSGRIGSLTLVVVGIAGGLMELVFPQDLGGIPSTFAGTMHFVMAGIASLGTMVALSLLAIWFRNLPALKGYVAYSWGSAAIIFISGGLTAAALANHHPLFGVLERITIGTFTLWLFVLGQATRQLESESLDRRNMKPIGST